MVLRNSTGRQNGIFGILLVLVILCYDCSASFIPIDDQSVSLHPRSHWMSFNFNDSLSGKKTDTLGTNAIITFQASYMAVFVDPTQFEANVSVLLNNIPEDLGSEEVDEPSVKKIFEKTGLDPSLTHTLQIMRHEDAQDNKTWNILFAYAANGSSNASDQNYTTDSGSSSTAARIETTTNGINTATQNISSAVSRSSLTAKSPSGGVIAGAVVGTLFGVSLIIFISFMLYRHRSQSSTLTPDPLMIEANPTSPPPPYSDGRRTHARQLPRFTAPPSVWPPSTRRNSFSAFAGPSFPEAQITPYTLPAPAVRRKPVPPPPTHPVLNRTNISFFVANQHSQPSHSDTSQSTRSGQGRQRDSAPPILTPSIPALEEAAPVVTDSYSDGKCRVDKGKQRAPTFEIEPLPKRPRKVRRGHSVRRLFFTTNPNPSTSSSSSVASSRRAKSLKRAKDFVREQARLMSPARQQPRAPAARPTGGSSKRPLPSTPKPPRSLPAPRDSSPTPPPPPLPHPRRNRGSQAMFYMTNPSSTHPSSNGQPDTVSLLSELPRPRLDKGKGRAY